MICTNNAREFKPQMALNVLPKVSFSFILEATHFLEICNSVLF